MFAAGDMRRGQSLVVWAIREGRQAALLTVKGGVQLLARVLVDDAVVVLETNTDRLDLVHLHDVEGRTDAAMAAYPALAALREKGLVGAIGIGVSFSCAARQIASLMRGVIRRMPSASAIACANSSQVTAWPSWRWKRDR